MDTDVYCYCSKCPPHKPWKRRTVLHHLQEDNKRLRDPKLGLSDLDKLRLKLCIECTGNSLSGVSLGQGMNYLIYSSICFIPCLQLEQFKRREQELLQASTSLPNQPHVDDVNWRSDDNSTLPYRGASPHHAYGEESEDISNPEDNDTASVGDSDRIDIDSDRFSDVSEEDFSDIREAHSNAEDPDLCTESMDVDDEHDTCSGSPTVLSGLSTPALDHLKAKLLGNYKCPAQSPAGRFVVPPLTSIEKLSLSHYIAWQTSGGTVKAYKLHAKVLEDATGLSILSLFRVQRLATRLTNLIPRKVDMCLNSCIAYTGEYAGLDACPYIATSATKACGAARYKQTGGRDKVPRAQLTVLPIKATIQALYANQDSSRLIQHRDQTLKRILQLTANAVGASKQSYSDFSNGKIHTEIHYESLGLFQDSRDIAFALSTDGAQLTMKKHSNTWILILILLNLPAEIRYQSTNVIINFATPGPNSPGDIESFLYPLFEEMAQASEGMWIWDALKDAYFVCRAWITLGLGDMLGSAKINGMAGHGGIYGDRFSMVQAAKTSNQKGARAQYYPILNIDHFNPDRCKYSFDAIPMRKYQEYFDTLLQLEQAKTKAEREKITRRTGILRLPLCAASAAFFHPSFFPIDPFHLFYENIMAFIWDLWTVQNLSISGEIFRLAPAIVATLGRLVEAAMNTLPPVFCGPVRNPHLKRQSQYKIYEWMALLHWYLVPMAIELGFHPKVIENFADFVWCVEFAMTPIPRTEEDLWTLRKRIVKFLIGFEHIYVGNDPTNNHRARLCVFQLIHVPIHIEWNGSIRTGSQATVERTIGEMGQKIKSRQLPFANLTNLIIQRERIRLLGLYYPDICFSDTIPTAASVSNIKATSQIQINTHELEDSNSPTFLQLQACLIEAGIPGEELQFNAV